jgi:catechol 2,3-dioxygenase-like lactoylglutathione lyase family enzyme
MTVRKLDHVNILSLKYDETLAFYRDLFDMKVGPTPVNDVSRGAWIYDDGDLPILHVQKVDPADPARKFADVRRRLGDGMGTRSVDALKGSGTVEHVALQCQGYDRLLARLRERGIEPRTNAVPGMRLRQLFIADPNGIVLELNFPGD